MRSIKIRHQEMEEVQEIIIRVQHLEIKKLMRYKRKYFKTLFTIKPIYFLKTNLEDLPFLKILLLACLPLRNFFCSSKGN